MKNLDIMKRLHAQYQNAQRKQLESQKSEQKPGKKQGKDWLLRAPIMSTRINDTKRDCTVWDIEKDINSRTSCHALGEYLTPPNPSKPEPGDFWINAAQHVIEELELFYGSSNTQDK